MSCTGSRAASDHFTSSMPCRDMRLFAAIAVAILASACNRSQLPPHSPESALQMFEIEEGFSIELFAAEPLVMDPVAMDIDEYGRVYVVEMPGYPLDTSGSGRIRMLHDTDGDGTPDEATLFADGLRLPTGVMRWKEGILVTDPPDVLYLEDTDGDGHSDLQRRILTGFALSNPQHNANTPIFGLDNWIYIANNATISWTEKYADPFGDRGEEIHFVERPAAARLPVNGADRNIRFRPDSYELESLSGKSQFGHTFDAWGRHFLNDNSHHHYYEAIAARYFERNASAVVGQATQSSSDHGDAADVYPITVNPEHQLLTDRGVFTSACGITYYLGGLFPVPYDEGVTFSAEPVHNLVHVDKVHGEGAGFVASRMREGREFLASSDSWFRPVSFRLGPDGALYLVDYYRQIVEHPEWMDDAVVSAGNLQRGSDRGRIYRIVPRGTGPPQWLGSLDPGSSEDLVGKLDDPNAWWRLSAQRLLLDRQDSEAAPLLRTMAAEGATAEGRLHALWTLDGLRRLDSDLLQAALHDPHPGVRENAVRLAEKHLEQWPNLALGLIAASGDPDARVRFQVLNSLGAVAGVEASRAQRRILEQDMQDGWVQAAALLSMDATELLEAALSRPGFSGFVGRVAESMARSGNGRMLLGRILIADEDAWWHAPALNGLARGGSSRALTPGEVQSLSARLWAAADPEIARAALEILNEAELPGRTLETALAVAANPEEPVERRTLAVDVLATDGSLAIELLRFLRPEEPLDVQLAVLRGLGNVAGTSAAREVLARWTALTPRIRQEALRIFFTIERAPLLMEALEDGRILASELSWNQRVRLMRDTEEPLRSRARTLLRADDFAAEPSQSAARGNAERGAALYASLCATCHAGGTFGPDLATVRHWPSAVLAADIRNPGRSIASGYELWDVVTGAGDSLRGIIGTETPSTITLVTQSERTTILRSDLAGIRPVVASAMPENLVPDEEAMEDLVAYLKRPN